MNRICIATIFYIFSSFSIANPQEEFVVQILEPTGGKVLRPSKWFYHENHSSLNSLNWVISKEEPTNGYDTGLSIQFLIGIKDKTGMTPEQFVKKNLQLLAESTKEASLCEVTNVGFFNRQCLEVEEEQLRDGNKVKYHVLYSAFWNNETDMVGITVAGSPSESWEKYSHIFNKMSEIKLIDLERLKNQINLQKEQ